ncbi:MAG: permease-like cell division protein FtsX [Elusimicrobia bacterium]|nr:permease-like cell division protein FtsX [Elusimicrobiota bacterium]
MEHAQHHDHSGEGRKTDRKGYRVVFLIVFAGVLMAEALLFMRAQVREIALILKEDFRIVIVKSEKIKRKPAAMEEALKALPGTKDVVFISKADRLKKLKEEDPDLVGTVMNMGVNPMPDTFEAELKEAALGDLSSWVEPAWKVPGVADIKYKPLEAYAILHALFYGHYMFVTLALAFFSLVLMALMTLAYRNSLANFLESVKRDRNWFFTGLGAGSIAVALSYALVYPVKYLSPLWLWPDPLSQAAIIAAGGLSAWVLFQWKNTHN